MISGFETLNEEILYTIDGGNGFTSFMKGFWDGLSSECGGLISGISDGFNATNCF